MTDDRIPYLLIEVTIAGAFVGLDGKVVGDNVAEATLQFGWRADNLPDGLSDERINEALRRQMGPILVGVRMSMTGSGWAFLGETDEPMTSHATPTGQVMKTDAVRVFIPMPGAPEGMTDHIHAYTLGPTQAMEEDADFRARCGCGQREPAGCPKHRRYWVDDLLGDDGVWVRRCPCGTVIGHERDGVRTWLRP